MKNSNDASKRGQQNPANEEKTIPINGFQQVFEMLRVADPAFRESLLKRLAQRDQNLAMSLRRDLKNAGIF